MSDEPNKRANLALVEVEGVPKDKLIAETGNASAVVLG